MVTVADNTLPVEAIFVVTVVYKVGDDLRTAETHVKVWHGSATTIIVLGKHDEDFKVLKVTALPYVPAGPATEAEL